MNTADVPGLEAVLAPEGWPYASSPPAEPGDPGRFHALFGRDGLITALQVLPARPDVAAATLRALAALQGTREDPDTDEAPGRIPHEHRPQAPQWIKDAGMPVRDGALLYYGSADSTSWFLVVLAATEDAGLARELEPAWRAAAGWLERTLAQGGGLLRYGPRRWPGGLVQQGWRDAIADGGGHEGSGGGYVRPDGTRPEPPIADADCQAVAVAALDALAALEPAEPRWTAAASALRLRVGEAFGPEVMALEGDGTVLPGAGSQLGWLLWARALEGDAATAAADRLCRPDVLTDWGLRTLSADHPAFRAGAYHRGSVWPFDSWLGWGGLRAAGRAAEAERVRSGVLAALDRLGRFPELYAVTAAGEPEAIPIANRVQAWSLGARWALEHDWDGRRG